MIGAFVAAEGLGTGPNLRLFLIAFIAFYIRVQHIFCPACGRSKKTRAREGPRKGLQRILRIQPTHAGVNMLVCSGHLGQSLRRAT